MNSEQELRQLTDESVALLREMIAIPSPSFEEERVSNHVQSWMEARGMHPQRFGNNLVCRLNPRPGAPVLMLCAHLDTVSPASDYSFDPYKPDPEVAAERVSAIRGEHLSPEEVIAGLGSNDDGASATAQIAVFRFFSAHPELLGEKNLLLALSCQEERSGPEGMRSLWKEQLEGVVDAAIVGEPTAMQAAISERGLLVLDAVAHGLSGHAARNEGVNALYIAIEDIAAMRAHRFGRKSPVMGDINLNVTQINAGTAHNVIPDRCCFVVDIRTTEQYTSKEILDELQGICKSTLTPRNLTNRSSAGRPLSPLMKAADDCGMVGFSSQTTSDWMRISCNALKMGPGDSSRSHKKDEYVLCSELMDGVVKYVEFIQKLNLQH